MTWLVCLSALWAPLLLIGAAFEVRTQRRLRQEGIRVQGKVVRHEQDPDSESRNVHFPIVAFTSADGQTHECRTSYSGTHDPPTGWGTRPDRSSTMRKGKARAGRSQLRESVGHRRSGLRHCKSLERRGPVHAAVFG
jgi:hypothetical protein